MPSEALADFQALIAMGFYYERVIRPLLFRVDPEKAHDIGVTALDYLGRIRFLCRLMESFNQVAGERPIELMGLEFPNAVGLAAGMDKNGRFWRAAAALGFGHVEIGTVTWHRQPGNERPRLFRYPDAGAIINRMGFNNDGAEEMAKRLKASQCKPGGGTPVGVNIGKSKITSLDHAVEDYVKSFQTLAEFADYVAINVSSPNTPDLRKLQSAEHLDVLLDELAKVNRSRARKLGEKEKPLVLKIAPDLSFAEIEGILQRIESYGIAGIIATNTTIERPGRFSNVKESGGLSGRPLHRRSLEVVNYISRSTGGRLPIIGVGGIDSPETAGAMVDAGAHLVQLYSGMIYRGPFIPKQLAKALAPRQKDWI